MPSWSRNIKISNGEGFFQHPLNLEKNLRGGNIHAGIQNSNYATVDVSPCIVVTQWSI